MSAKKIALTHVHRGDIPHQEKWFDLLDENIGKVKNSDTEIVHKSPDAPALERAAPDSIQQYAMFLNNHNMVELIQEAEDEDFDGVLIACSTDPTLKISQTTVDIPVGGCAENSFHYALTMGKKFGIVSAKNPHFERYWEKVVHKYGLDDQLVGVEPLDMSAFDTFTKGWEDPQYVADNVEEKSRKLVEQGADSVIIGSGGMSTMSTASDLSHVDGAPVIDVMVTGFKMLEAKVDVVQGLNHPPVSRAFFGERFPQKDLDRVNELFGINQPE